MATIKVCDICGEPAVSTMEFRATGVSSINKDLCETHLAEIKKMLRVFTRDEKQESVLAEVAEAMVTGEMKASPNEHK